MSKFLFPIICFPSNLIHQSASQRLSALNKALLADDLVDGRKKLLLGQLKKRKVKSEAESFSLTAVGRLVGHHRHHQLQQRISYFNQDGGGTA